MSHDYSDSDDPQPALTPYELATARRRHIVSIVLAVIAMAIVLVKWG